MDSGFIGLSVDGDSQGVDRLFGALSAHMWPGMILKSGDKINEPVLPPHGEGYIPFSSPIYYYYYVWGFVRSRLDLILHSPSSLSELSEEESEYELEYEVLSSGSADPWENIEERWVSADAGGSTSREVEANPKKVVDDVVELGSSGTQGETVVTTTEEKPLGGTEDNNKVYELEDVEQLMSEIGNIRDNLRLMPDFQRREIAANLAMKMASMFGGGGDDSDNEEESEWSPVVLLKISTNPQFNPFFLYKTPFFFIRFMLTQLHALLWTQLAIIIANLGRHVMYAITFFLDV